MKKGKHILLSAILLAGGCRTLEKRAYIEEYKKGLKDGIEKAGNFLLDSYADAFRKHLLTDQLYFIDLQSACSNLASRYEQEGNEKEADFYRTAVLNTRIEIARIEKYFKNTE